METAHFGWCGPTRWRSWRSRGRWPNSAAGPVLALELPAARWLSAEVLDALRLRALRARERGFPEAASADLLGVARATVCRCWSASGPGGLQALPPPRHGRPLGAGRFRSDDQATPRHALLDHRQPQELGIPSPLGTRRAVAKLLQQECGVPLASRTGGASLRRCGSTPQRPARKARKPDPQEVRRWLEETYPAVVERAAAAGAEIFGCAAEGSGSDAERGRGQARPGHTAGKEVTGGQARVNVVSALHDPGEGHFLTFPPPCDTAVFRTFWARLLAAVRTKVFLILDSLRAPDNAAVQAWVAARRDRIEVIPLPK